MTLAIPMIHTNGTSKHRLVEELTDAVEAIEAAYQAIKQTAPNGRDYYPFGPDAFNAATNQHQNRLRKIDEVRNELEQLIAGIESQD